MPAAGQRASRGKTHDRWAYALLALLLLLRLQYLEHTTEVHSISLSAQKEALATGFRSAQQPQLGKWAKLPKSAIDGPAPSGEVLPLITSSSSSSGRRASRTRPTVGKRAPPKQQVSKLASNLDVDTIVAMHSSHSNPGDSIHIQLEEDDAEQVSSAATKSRGKQPKAKRPHKEGSRSSSSEPNDDDSGSRKVRHHTDGEQPYPASYIGSLVRNMFRKFSSSSKGSPTDASAGGTSDDGPTNEDDAVQQESASPEAPGSILSTVSVRDVDTKYINDNLTLKDVVTEMSSRRHHLGENNNKHAGLVLAREQFREFDDETKKSITRSWLNYFDGKDTIKYTFPKKLIELLPDKEPTLSYRTCAIVGNSGVVLLKENGKIIDSHDAVLRINMAPVRGYESYVGRRTDFNIVNAHNIKELIAGERKYTPDPEGPSHLVMFETASQQARKTVCEPLMKRFGRAKPILLNPLFVNECHRKWIQLKYLLEISLNKEIGEFHRKPMSGFFATCLALQMCDSLDLYGFDSYLGSKNSYKYHYFDDVQGFTGRHSFDLAIRVFRLLEKSTNLTINT